VALNRGWSYREQVGPDAAGQTLLSYLTATRPHSSEAAWAERIARGEVEIEGARVDGEVVLDAGQTVAWHRPPWDEPPVPTNFSAVHEDEAIVAINKPSGLPTMPAGGFLDHTLLSLIRETYPGASPLHRLGRHTSGLVLFAKTSSAASTLARAWRDHEVNKTYRALGRGVARQAKIVIDVPIGPVPHPVIGTVQAASETGKPSQSVATMVEQRDDQALFSVAITTGRPHQIRIHLAAVGHPLVGDPMYAAGGGLRIDPGLPGDGGYYLHAERLEFPHPATGQHTVIIATPPAELRTRSELIHGFHG
jgi:23S rRNA pseudouridine1911/1915/1917 synthase